MLTRREMLALAAVGPLQADPASDASELWDYFDKTLTASDANRQRKLREIRTPADLATLQEHVRRTLTSGLGDFPARTPLNTRQVGEIVRPDYVIEKLIFQSRPGFFVTANLYRPKATSTRRPAVVEVCGHYVEGKATPDYAKACASLAMRGIVALILDPVGQGERVMMRDAAGKPLYKSATGEHVVAGGPAILLGRTLANYMIWDVVRALDYLESRPDVDASRMGMFGHSGGGMQTLLTAPIEPRIRAAMSCCAVTSFYHKTQALLNADPEQIVPGVYAAGVDHPELIAAVAPRAFLIGAVLRDFVPLTGTRRTFDEVKPLFEVAGVPGNVAKVESDSVHLFDQNLREACCGWMMKHLTGEARDTREPAITVETEDALRCTRTGSVMDLESARSVFDLNREECRRLAGLRKSVRSGALQAARNPANPTLLLVAEHGRNSPDARHLAEQFRNAGFPVLGVDLPGWGDRKPNPPGKKAQFAWDDFFAWRSFEMGHPLLQMRVSDLVAQARTHRNAYLIGIDAGGIVALHSAEDSSIAGVATWRTLRSWNEVFDRVPSTEPVSSFVPGALLHYDIPDLVRSIAPRPVIMIDSRAADPAREILKGLSLL
jgi:dienelactone hydrolase